MLYPGSVERVDFGEEHEAKGFLVADVTPGQFAWEFVETPARRFVTLAGTSDLGRADLPELVQGTIVRILDVSPEDDVSNIRRDIESLEPFEITSVTQRRPDAPEIAGGLSESLGPLEALSAYFADDPDAEPLVALGRELLEAAA